METMYTVKDLVVNKLLGYKERMIRKLINEGQLRSIRIKPEGGKHVKILVPESAVKEFLEKATQQAAASSL